VTPRRNAGISWRLSRRGTTFCTAPAVCQRRINTVCQFVGMALPASFARLTGDGSDRRDETTVIRECCGDIP
jgi:hypothetical protein